MRNIENVFLSLYLIDRIIGILFFRKPKYHKSLPSLCDRLTQLLFLFDIHWKVMIYTELLIALILFDFSRIRFQQLEVNSRRTLLFSIKFNFAERSINAWLANVAIFIYKALSFSGLRKLGEILQIIYDDHIFNVSWNKYSYWILNLHIWFPSYQMWFLAWSKFMKIN